MLHLQHFRYEIVELDELSDLVERFPTCIRILLNGSSDSVRNRYLLRRVGYLQFEVHGNYMKLRSDDFFRI